jgi:predicted signal transduction protein with EAL and GGDEF domain
MSGGLGWALTNFVLEEAIRQCGRWWRSGRRIGVSVNLAPGRLADDVLPSHIEALLGRESLPPHALTVEITEHRCSIDPVGIREALVALARLGVRLSLDDFGTGESSLARLRHLHFDEIKIDRSSPARPPNQPTATSCNSRRRSPTNSEALSSPRGWRTSEPSRRSSIWASTWPRDTFCTVQH